MRRTIVIAVIVSGAACSASAQTAGTRWYGGAALNGDRISQENTNPKVLPSASIVAGVNLTRSFGLEIQLDSGFGELSRIYEGTSVSFAPAGSSRDEIDRLAATARYERYARPGLGGSILAVWRVPNPGRVSASVFLGATHITYKEREAITTLTVPPGIDPDNRSLAPLRNTVTARRGGLTAGVSLPIQVRGALRIAPELRYTYGSIGDEIYGVFRTGVRVLWGL